MNAAKQAHQEELEALFSKNQLLSRMRQEFRDCKEPDLIAFMKDRAIPEAFGIDLLVQMALHKRCDLPTLVGCLRFHCDSAQECVDLIYKCAVLDLVHWDPTLEVFIVIATISEDVQQELDRFQFPLPMVVPPKELTNNRSTGYFLTGGSVILRDNHHDDDVVLEHLNKMNSIKLKLNWDTATMVKNQWKNLDKKKEDEDRAEFEKRKRAFEKYDKTAHDVLGLLTHHGNEFHLTHRYDKRGRIYCQGYHVTYQGNAWNKAIIEFLEGEIVEGF